MADGPKSLWRDMEQQRPEDGQRVIVLFPFGLRVQDDTWDGVVGRWLNTEDYVSHWMPIDPPGTYAEIMPRPKGPLAVLPVPKTQDRTPQKNNTAWFSAAVAKHFELMETIVNTQFLLRLEASDLNIDDV